MPWYRIAGASLLLLFAVFLICGCSTVVTKNPLTTDPNSYGRDNFEGSWLIGDNIYFIRFAANGIARIAVVVWEDDRYQLGHGEMIVKKGDKSNYLSVRFKQDPEWMDDYIILQYLFTDTGDLVLWIPNADIFEKAIKDKKLQGVIKKKKFSKDITITSDPAKLLDFLSESDNLNLFDYREPIILRRVTSPKENKKPAKPEKRKPRISISNK